MAAVRIDKPKRSRSGAKRLDLTDMRHLFMDRRVWTAIGTVTKPDGATSHWELVTEDGVAVDILVDVVLQPSGVPVTCRIRAGIFEVPAEGDEVAVLVPEGETDFMPVLICKLSGNVIPTTQGPNPTNIVIVAPSGGTVLVHDGAGGASELALKSDVQDLADYVATEMVIVTPSGNSTPGVAPDPSPQPPSPTGTSVLKAK